MRPSYKREEVGSIPTWPTAYEPDGEGTRLISEDDVVRFHGRLQGGSETAITLGS
jgi:hypothetical protein